MLQVYLIIKPVIICIIASIAWVKFTNPSSPYYGLSPLSSSPSIPTSGGGGAGNSDSTDPWEAGKQALIILSQIIIATIVLVVLFKYNCMKVVPGKIYYI